MLHADEHDTGFWAFPQDGIFPTPATGPFVARQSVMLRLTFLVLATSCVASSTRPALTAADHERKARQYEATADSIETECWKDRRDELTVDAPSACWKAQDIRFLEANRNAAASHFAAATELRTQTAQR